MATPLSNLLDATGLHTATRDEIIAFLTQIMQATYGADVDLSSSSPDGQLINIIAQLVVDMQDNWTGDYNSRNPGQSIGTQLDTIVEINGIQRQAGTFTITPISITVDRALTLYGLDQDTQDVFTVSDNAGNQWKLQTTQTIIAAGTDVYNFQSAVPGNVPTAINTITVPVTIILGVTVINNPSTYTALGIDEESDAALRIRQQKAAVAQKQGFSDKLYTDLSNIPGMTDVLVHENRTDTIDDAGAPPHSLWVIVAGSADSSAIASAIYSNRGMGCNQKGAIFYIITQLDGTSFVALWDAVTTEPIYLNFNATSIDGVTPVKYAEIISGLPGIFFPSINQTQNSTAMGSLVQKIDPNCLVTGAGVNTSATAPFFDTISNTSLDKQFSLTASQIYILPVQLLPIGATVAHGATQQFTAYGGSQTGWVYSIAVNNSGGSINASTGLYTAGATPNVSDTIQAVDGDGNDKTVTVNVT
jgi:hypothetical protein